MYIPEKVTVEFHEGKRILMPEKIGVHLPLLCPKVNTAEIKLVFDAVNKRRTSPQSNSAMHPGS